MNDPVSYTYRERWVTQSHQARLVTSQIIWHFENHREFIRTVQSVSAGSGWARNIKICSQQSSPGPALLTPDISAVSRAGAGLVATGNTGYVCFNRPAEVRCPIRWEDLLNLLFGGSHSTVVALSRHLIGWLSADQPMRREPGGGIFPNLEVCTNEQNLVCCARQALQCSNSNPAFLLLLCAGPDEPAGPAWHQPRGQNMTNLILGSVIGITACLHPASLIYNIAQ